MNTKKTLAELLKLPKQVPTASRHPNHEPLYKPLDQLTADETVQLIRQTGDSHLLPVALRHLDNDAGYFGLLVSVLKTLNYPWKDNAIKVQHMRALIENALSELNEWDGDLTVQMEAMHFRAAILAAWAQWEQSLSSIPKRPFTRSS
jgi:hypothetical protein